jgi:hypothetical protein
MRRGLPATMHGDGSYVRSCEGFRMPVITMVAARVGTGVGKPPREEIAGGWTQAVPRALWGFELCAQAIEAPASGLI